ncbi:MAG TPA: MarC family protein [Oligoflexia bacterium]|nr:MarC family protein [Oligoflexia bacterium]
MAQNFVISFLGLFVAMDIIGILPMYLGMTRTLDPRRRAKTVNQSILVAAVVAITFIFVGKFVFKVLGIAIWDFKVGGGIVLLVMSILDLIRGKRNDEHTASTGVVPLAVPLITGPALITTVMLQVSLYGHLVVFLSLTANFVFAWFALFRSALITKVIGEEGTDIVSKIAALFMTAIAFSMIRSGIFEAIAAAKM